MPANTNPMVTKEWIISDKFVVRYDYQSFALLIKEPMKNEGNTVRASIRFIHRPLLGYISENEVVFGYKQSEQMPLLLFCFRVFLYLPSSSLRHHSLTQRTNERIEFYTFQTPQKGKRTLQVVWGRPEQLNKHRGGVHSVDTLYD